MRELVIKHPVLKYYDLQEEVTMQSDASEYGLGAALLQNGQPVAFALRFLSQIIMGTDREEMSCYCFLL